MIAPIDQFRGRSVFVTGHTGFKGAWLCSWLLAHGARVHGYSLPADAESVLFHQSRLRDRLSETEGDVRDLKSLRASVVKAQPEFVFHLAAQSLVRKSFNQPVETFATNVLGTVHLLEALRGLEAPCSVVIVTSDKCYENRDWERGYHEEDPLGGYDPYSSSKAAAEIAAAAYRRSYFNPSRLIAHDLAVPPVAVATARAGNVIGGGDWATDRLVPDAIRALARSEAVPVRNPMATRPWQHVLEPLHGYLQLALRLDRGLKARSGDLTDLCSAFNFGPDTSANRSTRELVEEILVHWPGSWKDASAHPGHHEANRLHLSSEKALRLLDWSSRWDFGTSVKRTVEWYRIAHKDPSSTRELISADIGAFENSP